MTRTAAVVLAALSLVGARALALDVGDVAPPLHVKKWVNNSPVTLEAAKGKLLVVEFWATWCGPCRQTIPHLNKLHKKYNDKEVVFAGITEEDEPTVRKYLETMAMDYHVGLDDGGKTNELYMKGIPGIPHAFVVGRDGKVAWHGHPLARLDRVLEQLVAGKFDPARAKKLADFREKISLAARARDTKRLLELLDETIRAVPDDPDAYRLKRNILRDQGNAAEAQATLLAMAAGCAKDPDVLVEVALTLSAAADLEHRDLPKAIELAKRAVEVSEGKAAGVLAALARVHYELGHVALAVEAAVKAAAVAEGEDRKRLEAQADFYRKELERRRKDPDARP